VDLKILEEPVALRAGAHLGGRGLNFFQFHQDLPQGLFGKGWGTAQEGRPELMLDHQI